MKILLTILLICALIDIGSTHVIKTLCVKYPNLSIEYHFGDESAKKKLNKYGVAIVIARLIGGLDIITILIYLIWFMII